MTWIPYDSDDKTANPLPKQDELVYVYDSSYRGVGTGRFEHSRGGGWWEDSSGSDDIGVTHWMPITWPEPPS